MGHWGATTLGSDGGWDAIASLTRQEKTGKICEFFDDAFAPPYDGVSYDEGAAPFVVSIAEVVAAALGRPAAAGLPESVGPWVERNAELAIAYRDRALTCVDVVAESPYATMWARPEGNAEFASSIAGLRERLLDGRTHAIARVEHRFLRHIERLSADDGWTVRHEDATLSRPIEGGCQRVRLMMVEKSGLWTAIIRFEVSFFEPQRLVFEATGRTDNPEDACVLTAVLPREHYDSKGRIRRLVLHRLGVDVPDGADLEVAALLAEAVLNPERTVRLAAERAVELIRDHGEAYFADHFELERFRPLLDPPDLSALRALGKPGTLNFWIPIAWSLEQRLGEAMLQSRRAKLANFPPEEVVRGFATLDQIEAALRGLGDRST